MKLLKKFFRMSSGSRTILFHITLLIYIPIVSAQNADLGEALDNTNLTWTTGGDSKWFKQTLVYYYDGDAAQSGEISHNQSSWIQTKILGPAILSFYWKVASSMGVADLKFYIDDVEKSKCWSYKEWELQTYSIPADSHTVKWDYNVFGTGDVGFLDKVELINGPLIILKSPNGGDSLHHRMFYSINWVTTEDVDSNVKIELCKQENPIYTISAATENDGIYQWFVPTFITAGPDYRIKITSILNTSIYDYSDNYFHIVDWFWSSFSGALIIDGEDDYAEAADNIELDLGNEPEESFTIEAWVYLQKSGSNFSDRMYIVKKPDSYNLYLTRYYDWSTGNYVGCVGYLLRLSSGQLAGVEQCRSPAYALGWHHIALVFNHDLSEVRIYMDGKALGNPYTVGENINDSFENLIVGKNLEGAIDQLRISNIARYLDQTYPLCATPFSCDVYTRALWHFDENEGDTLFIDDCGINNLLIGHNGAHTEGSWQYSSLSLQILIPNGGEDWITGTEQNILWKSPGTIENVKLEYFNINIAKWVVIDTLTPNDGSYLWSVPNTPSRYCLVKISETPAGNSWDVSDDFFTLRDAAPPSQVINLKAIETDSGIVLNWSPAIDNIGVDHYLVYCDTVSGFSPDESMTKCIDTFYVHSDAAPGINHYYRVSAVDEWGNEGEYSDEVRAIITNIEKEIQFIIPAKYSLYQNYPNPFNPITSIEFDLPKTGEVTLKIFNILGEEVATLVSDQLSAGSYSYEWDASNLASGVYLYQLEAGDFVETMKMILRR